MLAPLFFSLVDPSYLELRHAVVAEINTLRIARNLAPLKADSALMDDVQRKPSDDQAIHASGTKSVKDLVLQLGEAIYDPTWNALGVGASVDAASVPNISVKGRTSNQSTYALINLDRAVAYNPEVTARIVAPGQVRSIEISVNERPFELVTMRSGNVTFNLPRGTGLKVVYFRIHDSRGRAITEADSIYLQDCTLWPDALPPSPPVHQLGPPAFDPVPYEKSPGVFEVPLTFPVFGKVSWTDTWGASRGGGTRKHIGQDLPAEKLRHILAAMDGRFSGGNLPTVSANGINCTYIHLNNDNPGTDDGKGGNTYLYAPGIYPGMEVKAGMHIAYNGDSGNAEETISHLHFELHLPNIGAVNASPSLKIAHVETNPPYVVDEPDWQADERHEKRWDAKISKVADDFKSIRVIIAAEYDNKGVAKPLTKFVERTLDISNLWEPIELDDFIGVQGTDPGGTKSIKVSKLKILRKPKKPVR